MLIQLNPAYSFYWNVRKIAVIGPGIISLPMAALLAQAQIRIGTAEPAKVVVVQQNPATAGWKIESVSAVQSVLGTTEHSLDALLAKAVEGGLLSVTHQYDELSDADVILICLPTNKKADSYEPDFEPVFDALNHLAKALQKKPPSKIPLLIFESTLAPSSMATLMRDLFADYDLVEGHDLLMGNSPNSVTPGRLLEEIRQSDKLVAGLHPETPNMIRQLYQHIVTEASLYPTNSMTAEVTQTLESAYRDSRIAFSAEIARYCDDHNINFNAVRDLVNERLDQVGQASEDSKVMPSRGILTPGLGVGGHCLPKDGILLWWRKIDSGADIANSLILQSRLINDQSPAKTIELAERRYGNIDGKHIAIMGTAYQFNSEDTQNSPSIALALQLMRKGCTISLHDPYVKPDDQNLIQFKLDHFFTNELEEAVKKADYLFFGTAHKDYYDAVSILSKAPQVKGIVDACGLYQQSNIESLAVGYTGVGSGQKVPDSAFIDFVYNSYKIVETGLANEVWSMVSFLNNHFATDPFNEIRFEEIQQLAANLNSGYFISDTNAIDQIPEYRGYRSRLASCAKKQYYASFSGPSILPTI